MILGRQHRKLATMSNSIRICGCLRVNKFTIRQCAARRSYSQISVKCFMVSSLNIILSLFFHYRLCSWT